MSDAFARRVVKAFRVYEDVWEAFGEYCRRRKVSQSSMLEALMIQELQAADKIDVRTHDWFSRWIAEKLSRSERIGGGAARPQRSEDARRRRHETSL